MGKTTILVLEHKDSFVKQELTQEEYDKLQPRIQAKYKVKSTKEMETPSELDKKNR